MIEFLDEILERLMNKPKDKQITIFDEINDRLTTHKAQQYCIANDIKIYPVVVTKTVFEIEIDYNGDITRSDKRYNAKKTQEKIWELYNHFYKNRK